MRAALIVLLGAVLAIGGVACRASGGKGKEAPKAPEAEKPRPTAAEAQARQTQYARLAIVCAPGPGADAKYTGMILEQAKRNVR
jgi:hypothetical protein